MDNCINSFNLVLKELIDLKKEKEFKETKQNRVHFEDTTEKEYVPMANYNGNLNNYIIIIIKIELVNEIDVMKTRILLIEKKIKK